MKNQHPNTLSICLGLILSLLACSSSSVFAQGEANWWYFGNMAGIHFTPSGPVADLNGVINTQEGVATISDAAGNLLFYTDGITVWDNLHQVMPNGTGLLGNSSSTQSAIIVPRPGNSNLYYIFTVDDVGGADGLRYSEVDLTLNGGLGDVVATQKNIQLYTPVAEKVTAVRHGSNNSYWVLSHRWNSDTIMAYNVSAAGVNTTPVLSNGGLFLGGQVIAALGYMKTSPDGAILGSAEYGSNQLRLLEFDNTTGIASSPVIIPVPFSAYGLEFSPNSQKVFVSPHATFPGVSILQFDISVYNAATIIATQTTIGPILDAGQMQLGPDNKIYVNVLGLSELNVINDPNATGAAVNYQDAAVPLNGPTCRLGLPTFVQSFFSTSFEVSGLCLGDTTFFTPDTAGVDSVFWNFGDSSGGPANQSQALFPSYTYPSVGSYTVELIAFSDTISDTITSVVQIIPLPMAELGNDTSFCQGDTLELDVFQSGMSYQWQDSSSLSTYSVTAAGMYQVSVFNSCGSVEDSVIVNVDSLLSPFTFGPDTILCNVSSYALAPGSIEGNFLWQDGSSDSAFTATQSDTIHLTKSNLCSVVSDTIVLTFLSSPQISLPEDTLICTGDDLLLSVLQQSDVSYLWSDSSSGANLQVSQSGLYWLQGTNACDVESDSIAVLIEQPFQVQLPEDTIICQDSSFVLNAGIPGASYLWQDGLADSLYIVNAAGIFEVTVTRNGCEVVDAIEVTVDDVACFSSDCLNDAANVFTPNADGVNDLWLPKTACEFETYRLTIFNRWGNLIFESNSPEVGWNGRVHATEAEAGVYFWVLEITPQLAPNKKLHVMNGTVTLLR